MLLLMVCHIRLLLLYRSSCLPAFALWGHVRSFQCASASLALRGTECACREPSAADLVSVLCYKTNYYHPSALTGSFHLGFSCPKSFFWITSKYFWLTVSQFS